MPRHLVMFISIAAATVLLDGCGLYTGYSRERAADATDLIVGSADTAVADDEASRLASMSWQQLFTDPCLQQLIGEALERNADLRTARLATIEAEASLSAARKALLPSLDLAANAATSSYDGAKAVKTWSAGADVSWEADIFGRLTNERRMAAATVEERETYAQAVQSQLIATVASQYYTLLALDRKSATVEETIVNWTEYVSTLEALMEAGQSTLADVSQAQASLLSTEALREQLRQQTINTENSLCALVGRLSGTIARTTIEEQHMPSAISTGVSVGLLAQRPDVRSSESRLKQAYFNTAKAKGSFYPNLTLSGSAGWTNSGGAAVSNPGAALLSAAASLVQPIFNKGKLTANLKAAQVRQQQAAVEWQQSLLDAGKEVNDALAACHTSKVRCLLIAQQVEQLQQTVSHTQQQMQYGSANYLHVLTARQQLLSAQLDLIAERYAMLESLTTLFHALGGGGTSV
ncbi:MAG: efflux transporter outer membrane subunit [Prevotella sp.]